MGNEGLKIVIGADIGGLTNGLQTAGKNISQFGDAAEGSIEEARLTVKRMKAELIGLSQIQLKSPIGKELAAELRIAENELKALERESNLISAKSGNRQTVRAGVELSNLAVGTGNEIQTLNSFIHTFSRLSVETGSAKAAFAALGASIFSPTGLILALPLIIDGIQKLIEHFTGLSEKQKQAKKDADDLKNSINSSFGSTAKEATQVLTLVDVLKSETETRKRKNEALKELQKLAPDNFNNLKLEGDAVKGLDLAYQNYLANLKNVITVKILQARLEQLIEQQLKKQGAAATGIERIGTIEGEREQLQKLNDEYKKTDNPALLGQIKFLEQSLKSQSGAVGDLQIRINAVNDQLKAFTSGVELHKETTKKDVDQLTKQLSLLEKIRDAAKDFQGKLFDLKDIESATDKLAALEQQVGDLKLKIAVRDAKKAGLPPAEIAKLEDAIKQDTEKRLNEAFQKEALLLEFNPKLKISDIKRFDTTEIAGHVFTFKEKINVALDGSNLEIQKIPVDVTDLQDKISKATGLDKKIPIITIQEARVKLLKTKINDKLILGQLVNQIEELNKQLKEQIRGIFEGGLSDVFAGLGEGFGEALASSDFGSGLKKTAQNIIGIVGNVMQQLGKALITAAIKIKLLKETFEKWAIANPALAIVAGIGLVAAGAALKNIKFDGPKFADGGIVSSPVIGQIGERFRPEVIMPLDRLPQLFKQFGGDFGGGMQLVPIINNEGLFLAVKRGERSAGRKF